MAGDKSGRSDKPDLSHLLQMQNRFFYGLGLIKFVNFKRFSYLCVILQEEYDKDGEIREDKEEKYIINQHL